MKLLQIISLIASASLTGVASLIIGGNSGEELIKQYVEDVWNNRHLENLEKYLEPNYVRSCAVFPKLEQSERKCCQKSLEEMRENLKSMFYAISDLQIDLMDIVAEGNHVYATTISRGTEMRSSWGPASGKYFESKCAVHHRLSEKSGKIAFTEVFCDFSGMVQHFAPSPLTINESQPASLGLNQLLLGGKSNVGNMMLGGVTIDNINSGIEKLIAQKIMILHEAFKAPASKTELVQLHDMKFKSISPVFPDSQGGVDASREVDFNLAFMDCMSSSSTRASYNINRFYFEDLLNKGGVTISWSVNGIFSSACPAPYDKYKPTNKPFTLSGVSYHRFNKNGLLEEKVTMFDNEYVKKVLRGEISANTYDSTTSNTSSSSSIM